MSKHVKRDGVWEYTASDWAWGCGEARGNKEKEGGLPRLTCHGPTPPAYPLLGIRWPSHLVVVCPHHREGQWRARRRFVVVTSLSCAHIPQRGEGQ